MDKGKIFISSTVSDFEDLRSALKYWLSEMGYEVYTSETCDFPKNSTESSYNACFSTIEMCDWYILLIGSRYGSTFCDSNTNEVISITQAEYRAAYKLFTEGKIQKIIPFVRQKVWIAKQERESIEKGINSEVAVSQVKRSPSPNADMPVEIFAFIDEVGRSREMQKAHSGETPYPRGNWINVFNGFSDIINVLRIELNLSQRLSTLVYAENLIEEIKQNLRQIMVKNSQGYFGIYSRITPIRDKCIKQLNTNNKTNVSLTSTELQIIAGTFIKIVLLSDSVIKECLLSGIFLDYDPSLNRYRQSVLSKWLSQMEETINRINSFYQDSFFDDTRSYFMNLFHEYQDNPTTSIVIDYVRIAPILSEHDQIRNIIKLSNAILYQLCSGKKATAPELYPQRLCDNFEVSESKKEIFASYDEFYGRELTDAELDDLVEILEGGQYEA